MTYPLDQVHSAGAEGSGPHTGGQEGGSRAEICRAAQDRHLGPSGLMVVYPTSPSPGQQGSGHELGCTAVARGSTLWIHIQAASTFPGTSKREKQYQVHPAFGDRRDGVICARTYFYANEAKCDSHMETFLRCIEASGGPCVLAAPARASPCVCRQMLVWEGGATAQVAQGLSTSSCFPQRCHLSWPLSP